MDYVMIIIAAVLLLIYGRQYQDLSEFIGCALVGWLIWLWIHAGRKSKFKPPRPATPDELKPYDHNRWLNDTLAKLNRRKRR